VDEKFLDRERSKKLWRFGKRVPKIDNGARGASRKTSIDFRVGLRKA